MKTPAELKEESARDRELLQQWVDKKNADTRERKRQEYQENLSLMRDVIVNGRKMDAWELEALEVWISEYRRNSGLNPILDYGEYFAED